MKIKHAATLAIATGAVSFSSLSSAATYYTNDFETAMMTDTSIAGFVIGNIINDEGGGQWFELVAAPNSPVVGTNGYSAYVDTEGGVDQGGIQLSTFSDYNDFGPFGVVPQAQSLTTFVYTDVMEIGAEQLGETITFSFDSKLGNITGGASTSEAFLKVLKTSDSSFNELIDQVVDNTAIGADWGTYAVSFTVTSDHIGELLQVGFNNTTNVAYESTGMFYDNLIVGTAAPAVPVPAAAWLFGSALAGLVAVRRKK